MKETCLAHGNQHDLTLCVKGDVCIKYHEKELQKSQKLKPAKI